jgi:ribosomal protein L16 Arg81 hydroxylase
VSDPSATLTIVAAVGTLIASVATPIAAYFMLKLKQQGEAAALREERAARLADQVAITLAKTTKDADTKLNKIAVVADATHKLVNSAMTVQLQLVASALRRVADLTKDKSDRELADAAEVRLYEHQQKQLAVDANNPKGIPNAGDKNSNP